MNDIRLQLQFVSAGFKWNISQRLPLKKHQCVQNLQHIWMSWAECRIKNSEFRNWRLLCTRWGATIGVISGHKRTLYCTNYVCGILIGNLQCIGFLETVCEVKTCVCLKRNLRDNDKCGLECRQIAHSGQVVQAIVLCCYRMLPAGTK